MEAEVVAGEVVNFSWDQPEKADVAVTQPNVGFGLLLILLLHQ